MSTARQLLEKVVEPGLCIGCGACAVLPGSPLTVRMNAEGRYQAAPAADGDLDTEGAFLKVCPFSSEVDEDALARAFIQPTAAQQHPEVGVHQTVAAGHVHAGSFRGDGSSGGMTSWFLDRLLAEDEIDGVLHVTPRGGAAGPLFKYSVSTSRESAAGGAGTRYYPVEMSGVLSHVRENPGRYAVVGVPCFIKAVRLLQLEDPVFRERVRYCVGIVCGHFKSARFAESLGWEKGIQPGELEKIDFRVEGDVRADLYDVSVSGGGTTRTESKDDYLATDWGVGLFKYNACDYCDDVMNETADITFGDAWLSQFTPDPAGDNIVITRSSHAAAIFDSGREQLTLTDITADSAAKSQEAGLRHRREGLSYRLAQDIEAGKPVPTKRVQPNSNIPAKRKRIYDARRRFVVLGDEAYDDALRARSFEVFRSRITPEIQRYREIYSAGLVPRAKRFVRTRLPGLTRWVKKVRGR